MLEKHTFEIFCDPLTNVPVKSYGQKLVFRKKMPCSLHYNAKKIFLNYLET